MRRTTGNLVRPNCSKPTMKGEQVPQGLPPGLVNPKKPHNCSKVGTVNGARIETYLLSRPQQLRQRERVNGLSLAFYLRTAVAKTECCWLSALTLVLL